MVDVYTTYYGRLRTLDIKEYCLVQISNTTPLDVDYNMSYLAPSWSLIRKYRDGFIPYSEFARLYKNSLINNPAGVEECLGALVKLAELDKPILLLCYEKDDNHCHRPVLINVIHEKVESSTIMSEALRVNGEL